MKVTLSATVHREGGWYVSWCPQLDVASQGRTVDEALSNLKEALALRLEGEEEDFPQEPFLVTTVEVDHAPAADSARS